MEQLIGILIFYGIYTLFNLLQKKSGGAPKAPPMQQPGKPGPVRPAQKPAGKPAGEQNREHLPDFLRRWIEEAEKLEREHQQPEPVVVQEPVEKPVDKQAQRKAASMTEGGYAEQSLQELQQKKRQLAEEKEKQDELEELLKSGITVSSEKKISNLGKLLKDTDSLRNAILLNEILKKPVFYRGPGFPVDR
ncbi:MAG: hypothetical protein KDH95_23510 [Calditrichaeota bacterium]|nr:hypothetical protein [Calditrichota bacterium]MCB0271148.1 hypothetical protein [Calditrichota bacterium]